ncbi:hypothetical protein BE221DRAFT_192074, partial [Ostreococcus tauri]
MKIPLTVTTFTNSFVPNFGSVNAPVFASNRLSGSAKTSPSVNAPAGARAGAMVVDVR